MAVDIRVIDRLDEFAALRGEWNDLLASSQANTLFLTWEWLHTWWRHFGETGRLSLVTVRVSGDLVAIAPLGWQPPRAARLQFIPALELLGGGGVGSDYLDVIVRRGAEALVARALADALRTRRVIVRLPHLADEHALGTLVAERLERDGWRARALRRDVCPFIPLAGHTFESYLATLGPSHRYNFRRRLRQLHRAFDVRFGCVESEGDRRAVLATLVTLHNDRWTRRGGSTALHTPALVSFHEAISAIALERGWLRLFHLALDGRTVATLYGFAYGGRFYFYQSGFDSEYARHSVGLVAMGLAIEAAIRERLSEFDLLHGDEAYKFLWARTSRPIRGIELYPPGVAGALSHAMTDVYRGARAFGRRALSGRPARAHVKPDLVVPSSR